MFLLGRQIFSNQIGFWAGALWLLTPGAALSSFLIATDAPLLFFVTSAILLLLRASALALKGQDLYAHAILLGVALGLALMSKYAAIYSVIGVAACTVLIPTIRRTWLGLPILLAGLITALIFLPNILWNAQNEFQTVAHTAANANWQGDLFKPFKLLNFLAQQFAVFGPIPLIAAGLCVAALTGLTKNTPPISDRTKDMLRALMIFAVLPISVVAMQAFISRAHANWAAASYPAAMLLASYWLIIHMGPIWRRVSAGLHGAVALALIIGLTNFWLVDALRLSNATKHIRGWETHVREIVARAPATQTIVIDDRDLHGPFLYHTRANPRHSSSLDPNAHASTHYEAFMPFNPTTDQPAFFVTSLDSDAHVIHRFSEITPLGETRAPLGNDKQRQYGFYEIDGYYGKRYSKTN